MIDPVVVQPTADNTAIIVAAISGAVIAIINAVVAIMVAKMAKVTDQIHVLTNSATQAQLLTNANLADFKAATTKLPADIQVAVDAHLKYEDHVRRQAIVDANK